MFCTNCGEKIDIEGIRFCPNCGKQLRIKENQPDPVKSEASEFVNQSDPAEPVNQSDPAETVNRPMPEKAMSQNPAFAESKPGILSTTVGRVGLVAAAAFVAAGIVAGSVIYTLHNTHSSAQTAVVNTEQIYASEQTGTTEIQPGSAGDDSSGDTSTEMIADGQAAAEESSQTASTTENNGLPAPEADGTSGNGTASASGTGSADSTAADSSVAGSTAGPAAGSDSGSTPVALADLSNYIEGNLNQYELETVLAYGPDEEQIGLSDSEAQGIMNELIEAIEPESGAARIETGKMGNRTTISLESINRYFAAFSDYRFSSDNIPVIERGRYIAWAPAEIDYVASANITSVCTGAGDLIVTYDYYYNREEDPGIRDAVIINKQRQAIFKQQSDGLYRLMLVTDLN